MSGVAPRKVFINEEEAYWILQRYNPRTIFILLCEIHEGASAKMDWEELVKRTATGITTAREYQMLWRHLAYRHELTGNIEDGDEPLDDDSDLEVELEAVPAPSSEELSNAEACAKRMCNFRKRNTNLPSSSGIKVPSSTQSEERLATRKAISLALDTPKPGKVTGILSGSISWVSFLFFLSIIYCQPLSTTSMHEGMINNNVLGKRPSSTASSSARQVATSESLPASSQPSNQATSQAITLNISNNSQATQNMSMAAQPKINDMFIRAGGRRAEPDVAASFLKATQSKTAIRMTARGAPPPSNGNNKTLPATSTAGKSASATAAPTQVNPVSASSSGMGNKVQKVRCSTAKNNPPVRISASQQVSLEPNSVTAPGEIEEENLADDMEVEDMLNHEIETALLNLDVDPKATGKNKQMDPPKPKGQGL